MAFLTLCFLLEDVVEICVVEGVGTPYDAVSSSDRLGFFERASFFRLLDLVGREYEGSFDAVTSRQSSLTRYGSVSLILSAENCGKQADERYCFRLRDRSVALGRAVVDVFVLDSGLERENVGRFFRSVE